MKLITAHVQFNKQITPEQEMAFKYNNKQMKFKFDYLL